MRSLTRCSAASIASRRRNTEETPMICETGSDEQLAPREGVMQGEVSFTSCL